MIKGKERRRGSDQQKERKKGKISNTIEHNWTKKTPKGGKKEAKRSKRKGKYTHRHIYGVKDSKENDAVKKERKNKPKTSTLRLVNSRRANAIR